LAGCFRLPARPQPDRLYGGLVDSDHHRIGARAERNVEKELLEDLKEVASMIEGVVHHCTAMEADHQYVDSHGQSTVAFAFSGLPGFQLLPN